MKGEVVGQFFFKGDHPSQFLLNLVQQFQRDLNVIFYQNMPNLHNWNKSAERKNSQKYLDYRLYYSLPCSSN
jgi:hypothetical protein